MGLTLLVALLAWLSAADPAAAQVRPLVIRDATVLTGTGPVIEHGNVVLRGGKISAVGRKVETPLLARELSAKGKYVTPGLIDCHSTLALRFEAGGGQATARAADAFDRYASDEIRAALQQGVTTAYLPARAASGVGGLGAVVRLRPGAAPEDAVLDGQAAVCLGVGTGQGPLVRVKTVGELRKLFQAAKDYRDAWEDYENSLKEYEQKLAGAAKKPAEETKKPAEETRKTAADRNPPRKPSPPKPDEGKAAKKEDQKADKKDELKKPPEPAKDRNAEMLLRVLDGELRLRVEAHDPADILNVLALAEEFNAALVLEGATAAYLVADRLAERDVPVVLSGLPPALAFDAGPARYARVDTAVLLQRAGVKVYFGSGVVPSGEPTPQLVLLAARAVGNGFDERAAFEALTAGAARLLGVEKEIGRLAPGLRGDVVIWSDHPFAPGARVEHVFIDGQEVYRAGRATPGDNAEGGSEE